MLPNLIGDLSGKLGTPVEHGEYHCAEPQVVIELALD
jgi:hypothetical protein